MIQQQGNFHKNEYLQGVRKTIVLALFVATGIILAVFEIYIPRPLPWIKPGLANTVALISIYLFGFREAVLVNCTRVVLVSLLTGGFAGPGFWLALTASISSALSMYLVIHFTAPKAGPVGVSMIGAFAHIFCQLSLAGFFIIGQIQVFYLLPFFIIPSFFAGLVVGILGYLLLLQLQKKFSLRYALPQVSR